MTNTVLLQINTSSIIQLVNTINLLKQQNINFDIIEDNQYAYHSINSSMGEVNRRTDKFYMSKKIGEKGLAILQLLSQGYTYSEIAEKSGVTVDGVRYYIKKIFRHLSVSNGRDAVRIYLTEMQSA